MRIRSIKPEFWRSEDIANLAVEDRLLFIGLWSYVDDNGVGIDRLADVCADLFALDIARDPSETFARVSRGLQNLSEAGRIVRYEVEGKQFLCINGWEKHQRIDKPNKPRFPRPDAENATIRDTLATPSRESRAWNRGTGEQGNRGTGEQNTCSPAPPSSERASRFNDFWAVYPRKVGKQKARGKYAAAVKRAGDEQTVIDGAHRLAADPNLPEAKFIPHPTTWLERDGWEDEPLPPRMASRSDENLARGYQIAQRYTQQPQQPELNPFEADMKEMRA